METFLAELLGKDTNTLIATLKLQEKLPMHYRLSFQEKLSVSNEIKRRNREAFNRGTQ